MDALHEVLTLAEGTDRPVAMSRDGVASWAPAAARWRVTRRGRARPLATVVMGVGVAFAVAAMISRLARPAPPAEHTVASATVRAPPAQTSVPAAFTLKVEEPGHALVEGPRVEDSPAPPVVEGTVASVLATGLEAPRFPPVRKGLRRAPKTPGSSSAKGAKQPLKADVDGVINPFE